MKSLLRKILPDSLWNLRHLWYAWRGAVRYGHPSEELYVIGVTGTSGKSSVIDFLRQALEAQGFTVGSLSTVDFYVAGERKLNDKKMTMLGLEQNQAYLRKMVEKKCDIAIIETTSEGRVQHRHRFINYDTMSLTNLYPEHIESHGSFEKYKKAKVDIFAYVASSKRKVGSALSTKIASHFKDIIPKFAIVNSDTKQANEFLLKTFDGLWTFGMNAEEEKHMLISDVEESRDGLHVSLNGMKVQPKVYGKYNAMNVGAVATILQSIGGQLDSLDTLHAVPGRIEIIEEAKAKGFSVIVDYAFEPVAIAALYETVKLFEPTRIIHVFGSTGGGRDVSRRKTVGEFIGSHADIAIVTDEDPYDDDPMDIIRDVAIAVSDTGKTTDKDLFIEVDRGKAIALAINMAQEGDIVLVTGKGSEQAMVVKGELIPWDDRGEVRKALETL